MEEKDRERDSASLKEDRAVSEASHNNQGQDLGDIYQHAKDQEADLEQGKEPQAENSRQSSKVQWTFNRCVAIAALCGSYVGSSPCHHSHNCMTDYLID